MPMLKTSKSYWSLYITQEAQRALRVKYGKGKENRRLAAAEFDAIGKEHFPKPNRFRTEEAGKKFVEALPLEIKQSIELCECMDLKLW